MIAMFIQNLRLSNNVRGEGVTSTVSLRPRIFPSVLSMIAGIVLITSPSVVDFALGSLLGVVVLFSGLLMLFVSSVIFGKSLSDGVSILGIGVSLVGLIMFISTGFAIALLGVAIGMLLLFQGLIGLRAVHVGFKKGIAHLFMAVGVISVIGGLVSLSFPFASVAVLTVVMGIWLMVVGTAHLIGAVLYRRSARAIQQQ